MSNMNHTHGHSTHYTNWFISPNSTHYADGVPVKAYNGCFEQGKIFTSILIIGYVKECLRPRSKTNTHNNKNQVPKAIISTINQFHGSSPVCHLLNNADLCVANQAIRNRNSMASVANACLVSAMTGVHPAIIALMDIQLHSIGIEKYAYSVSTSDNNNAPKMMITAAVPWNTDSDDDDYIQAVEEIKDLGTQNNASYMAAPQYGKYLNMAEIYICIISVNSSQLTSNNTVEYKVNSEFTVSKRGNNPNDKFTQLLSSLQ
jgi:hypothetical protein